MILCFACMQFSWVCQQPLSRNDGAGDEPLDKLHQAITGMQPVTTLA